MESIAIVQKVVAKLLSLGRKMMKASTRRREKELSVMHMI